MRWSFFVPAILSAALLSLTELRAADAPTKIKPALILSGKDSGISKPFRERCCSYDELRAVWNKHQEGDDRHFCPEVNFDSFMVIAIFYGVDNDHSPIAVLEIVEDTETIRIRLDSGERQTGVIEIDGEEERKVSETDRLKRTAPTQSYQFIVLPASKKTIVFEVGHPRDFEDPNHKWKEHELFSALPKK
jgi:hypothetical protein